MTYLIKALVDTTSKIEPNKDAKWTAGQLRLIDDSLLAEYQNNPAAFTVLAGPGLGEILTAAQSALAETTAGAKNGATVTAAETGSATLHQTTLTLADTPVTMRDTEQGGGVKIYGFPAGRIVALGATGSIAVKTTSILANTLHASVTCNWGIGSTTQASATLATTEQDIINVAAFTASATINVAGAAAPGAGALVALDGTTTPVDAFLNLAVANAVDIDANATVTVSGSVTITWMNLGD